MEVNKMKMIINAILVGCSHNVSAKGNKYDTIMLADGNSTIKLMVGANLGINIDNLVMYKPYTVTVNYNQWKKFDMLGMEAVK
jgi:hypothetical protein